MKTYSILLVEDEDLIAENVIEVISDFGYEFCGRATSGADAIGLSLAEEPDLILMDINIEGEMDGVQAAKQIRKTQGLPIVFLTSLNDDATLKRAAVTDPAGYVLKPFRELELRTAIEIALHRNDDKTSTETVSTTESDALPAVQKAAVEFLSKIEMLKVVEQSDLQSLTKGAFFESFDAKENIQFEGEISEYGIIVVEGRVAVSKSSASGKDLIVEMLPPGDLFGLFSTMNSKTQAYSLTSHNQTKVLFIPKGQAINTLDRYPDLVKELLADIFDRLRGAHDLSRSLAHDLVEVRIASALLALLPKFFSKSEGESNYSIQMTRQELGEMVGSTSETVIRVTKRMEREGILDLKQSGVIVILDKEQLEATADRG